MGASCQVDAILLLHTRVNLESLVRGLAYGREGRGAV